MIAAPTRDSLVGRTRALDRVLLAGFHVIPNWHIQADRLLYWDKFSRPETTTKNGTSIDYWWFDEAKAARLEAARGPAATAQEAVLRYFVAVADIDQTILARQQRRE